MKKLPIIGLVLVLPLLGAWSCSSGTQNTSPSNIVFMTRTGYDATVFAPFHAYAILPDCATHPQPCSKTDVIQNLDKLNKTALAALDAAEDTVTKHKEIDAQFAIAAANNAIKAIQTAMTTYGVK